MFTKECVQEQKEIAYEKCLHDKNLVIGQIKEDCTVVSSSKKKCHEDHSSTEDNSLKPLYHKMSTDDEDIKEAKFLKMMRFDVFENDEKETDHNEYI